MTWLGLITFILVSAGLTQILCYGSIFDSIRPNGKFWRCTMCVGFWSGICLWIIAPLTELFIFDRMWITGFMLGCLSSCTSYLLSNLVKEE